MELMLLRTFQKQVATQCKYLLFAAQEVNLSLQHRKFERTFYALQNMLNAGANISKALWGQGGKFSKARKQLRDSIGVSNDSPLRQVTMRNNFEHFDERLDRWWKESERHNHVDHAIGPKDKMFGGLDNIDQFRMFDPQTAELTFWGQEFNLQKLVDEVDRILPKLQEEANKPHWETKPPGPRA